MSSIITTVFKSTLGILWEKARDHTAEKLKDGELTDEECRKIIVREMEDIKSKLDGLSRKDLLSSASFLKEGLALLEMSLGFLLLIPTTQEHRADASETVTAVDVFRSSGIVSEKRFIAAKERFKTAREEATRAYNNTALSLEDRVLAMKLRVTAVILESIDDPDLAVLAGKSFIQELNEMPAIEELFSVWLTGGIKAFFNKSKRHELTKSVLLINFVMFSFTTSFAKVPLHLLDWPMITVGQKSYLPIVGLQDELSAWASEVFGNEVPHMPFVELTLPGRCPDVVNSMGEIIIQVQNQPSFEAVNTASDARFLFRFPEEHAEASCFNIISFAVDVENNLYIITSYQDLSDVTNYKIFIVDAKGDIKHQSLLEFLSGTKNTSISMIVSTETKDKKIIIGKSSGGNSYMYICDSSAKPIHCLPFINFNALLVAVTDRNDVIAADFLAETFQVFTKEGKLKKTITLPNPYRLIDVSFNYITRKIIALVGNDDSPTLLLINYSEAEEFKPRELYLGFKWFKWYGTYARIFSHPKGPLALAVQDKVIVL